MSRWACAWGLDNDPKSKIIYTSYGAALAVESGKEVRALLTEHERDLRVKLMGDSKAADSWRTTEGGGMWSAGVGGPVTGRRATDLVVDDPHKSFADAHSEYQTEGIWNWYRSTAVTRCIPRARKCVIQTRWSTHDLVGRLQSEQPHLWTHVRLPAIAEVDETIETVLGEQAVRRLRAIGVPLPIWHRDQGEALWPTRWDPDAGLYVPWYDEKMLAGVREEVGEVVWQGLYQQNPPKEDGDLFRAHNWRYCESAPMKGLNLIRWWDTAATEKKQGSDPDWTAGVLMGRATDGLYYILDIERFRADPVDVERRMRLTAIQDYQRYGSTRQGVSRDPGSAGKLWTSSLARGALAGFACEFNDEKEADKYTRALPFAAQQGANNVYLVRGPEGMAQPAWIDPYVMEATSFPGGKHDDMVDASAQAFRAVAGLGLTRVKLIS
jgi:predicted phage terminase large subunit-like protein